MSESRTTGDKGGDLPFSLSLDRILELLREATIVAEGLHGQRTAVDSSGKLNPHLASINNRLRRLADLGDAVATEANMTYWTVKGHLDPRTKAQRRG